MGLSFKKIGNWDLALQEFANFSQNINKAYEEQIQKDGEDFLKKLLSHIDNQDLDWVPLSDKTVELKNGDTRIYIETGYLRDNLDIIKLTPSGADYSIFVGVGEDRFHPDSGVSLNDLMIWMEYGTDKMPARPLLRPTWEEAEPSLKNDWKRLLLELISKLVTKLNSLLGGGV